MPAAGGIQRDQVVAAHQLGGIFQIFDGVGSANFAIHRILQGHVGSFTGARTRQVLRSWGSRTELI